MRRLLPDQAASDSACWRDLRSPRITSDQMARAKVWAKVLARTENGYRPDRHPKKRPRPQGYLPKESIDRLQHPPHVTSRAVGYETFVARSGSTISGHFTCFEITCDQLRSARSGKSLGKSSCQIREQSSMPSHVTSDAAGERLTAELRTSVSASVRPQATANGSNREPGASSLASYPDSSAKAGSTPAPGTSSAWSLRLTVR